MPDFCCCSGVEFSAQTFCKAWQNAQSCSGEFCPKFPRLGFQTPQCPWMHSEPTLLCVHQVLWCQGSQGITLSWIESTSLPHQHMAQTHCNYRHRRKVEPGEGEKGEPPWLLLIYRHSQWISGKRIQQIHPWKSLAPRTFPYQSQNPPSGISKLTFPMPTKFLSPRTEVCH